MSNSQVESNTVPWNQEAFDKVFIEACAANEACAACERKEKLGEQLAREREALSALYVSYRGRQKMPRSAQDLLSQTATVLRNAESSESRRRKGHRKHAPGIWATMNSTSHSFVADAHDPVSQREIENALAVNAAFGDDGELAGTIRNPYRNLPLKDRRSRATILAEMLLVPSASRDGNGIDVMLKRTSRDTHYSFDVVLAADKLMEQLSPCQRNRLLEPLASGIWERLVTLLRQGSPPATYTAIFDKACFLFGLAARWAPERFEPLHGAIMQELRRTRRPLATKIALSFPGTMCGKDSLLLEGFKTANTEELRSCLVFGTTHFASGGLNSGLGIGIVRMFTGDNSERWLHQELSKRPTKFIPNLVRYLVATQGDSKCVTSEGALTMTLMTCEGLVDLVETGSFSQSTIRNCMNTLEKSLDRHRELYQGPLRKRLKRTVERLRLRFG